jgi:hypothetical protein
MSLTLEVWELLRPPNHCHPERQRRACPEWSRKNLLSRACARKSRFFASLRMTILFARFDKFNTMKPRKQVTFGWQPTFPENSYRFPDAALVEA